MEKGQRKSTSSRRRRTTYEESKSTLSEELCKFVPVPKHLMGYVIGKKGSTIKQILCQSGARVITQDRSEAQLGFMVYGSKEEIKRAEELINEKLQTKNDRHHASPCQLVKIPGQFKKVVNGPGGDNLRNVSTITGTQVTAGADNRLYVRGQDKNVQHAEFLLRNKVASSRFSVKWRYVFIDDRYLPEGYDLKLSPVQGNMRMILPGAKSQYRLKPAYEYETHSKGAYEPHHESSYDASLEESALSSLREIKKEIDSGNYHMADMWCHFGRVIIRDPDEVDVDDTWSIAEAARKVQSTHGRRNEWRVAFKEGVDISEKEIQDTFGQQTEQDFIARYDLSFLTPRSQAIRCKVWVANKRVEKKLDEIPIPFSDVSNVVEELRFEDESTRARCRGWLVLQSKKFLQADIIFPGCNIDCRLFIRALTDDAFVKANGVHEKEATDLLSQYLSKLTYTDADGLILPDEELPRGYLFNHRRCSKRVQYIPRSGFSMIISKEKTWTSDSHEEEKRDTIDIHLGCEEWDQALSGQDWEPEVIVARLPEFLNFVRDVQNFISHSNLKKENGQGTDV